ncbi:MAG TPA: PQQ-binding-like beta-propeller repeat protein [Pirellulales bacterium]|nr:PQQ-binding-like beta-propeller repeat protein [Pirellulales bacterium]
MHKVLLLVAVMACGLWNAGASAADWPEWRGPHRDGVSAEKGLLKEWPAAGPKLAWQITDAGAGYSTPSVVKDRLYLISNKGMDDEYVAAHEVADGKQVWQTRIGKVGQNTGPQYPGSRSTPTIDGELLFALGSDGDLVCLELASGKIIWQKSLRTDYSGRPGNWAYSESPLVDGDAVVCTPGGSEATLVALNKNTGDTIWKSAVPEGDQAAYASIIIVDAGGLKQYVQFLQKGLVGVDAKTGKFLWRYDKTAKGSPANIPTPIAHNELVYSAAGRSGGALVRLKIEPQAVEAEEIYFTPKLPTSIGGAVLVEGYLYGTNSAGLLCADFATGEIKWQDRSVGAGSTCYADGRLYVHGEKGDVALVEATSEAYREKGRFSLPGQPERGKSQAWAYPVVANGRLYIRDLGAIWCYDVKDSQ